jgi:membrane protease YdiL (CAAX protease family)
MGMIGYPIAMRRRGGLERFHQSGFTWWLITLTVVLVLVLTSHPGQLDPANPASSLAADRVLLAAVLALVACLCLESSGALLQRARQGAAQDRGSQRYESALPKWARTPGVETTLLGVTAVLEEAIYRGIGLTWLTNYAGASVAIAVGVSAVAFGAAHWYYGPRQIFLKTLLGVILGITALTAGWIAAAIAHFALNTLLIALASRVARPDHELTA